MSLDPATLAALCIWDEAGNQPPEGRRAVAVVLLKRMARRYQSDGTVAGTVLRYDQFSGFYFAMIDGEYKRVCSTPEEAAARAETLLLTAQAGRALWADCQQAWTDAQPVDGGSIGAAYAGGPEYQKLVAAPDALLYVNLAVSQPAWATPDKLVAKIFAHSFYRP